MKRLYEAAAYGPLTGCFWADDAAQQDWGRLGGDIRTDVAIVGGGYTGLSAALHLAQDGVDVTLLEAETPGWGASGRNGGFCCLGGAKAPRHLLKQRFGADGLAAWHDTEKSAIDTVETLLRTHDIAVDRHSQGETLMAHTPRAMARMRAHSDEIRQDYGVTPHLTEPGDLRRTGLGGPFHGALTIPLGFALNPRKYHAGLARAARAAGARLCASTPVMQLTPTAGKTRLATPAGTVLADRVILATNGYSSEDVPDWLRARTLPVQSSVIVTRPLTGAEQEAQGWTSDQMAYDTRHLLHYFRKLPDDRFLFGMRGGLSASSRASAAIRRRIRADFHAMFPAWAEVEITHDWSGLVCLMVHLAPFVGPVDDLPGVFAGLGYHGNGVAMASHSGRILASLVQGREPDVPYPAVMRMPPGRFPLGRFRRALLAPAYIGATFLDR